MLLENKIAVVTGAGRGIGRGIALAMAREGAMVVVNYNGSKDRAESVVSEIEENGGKAVAIQCNVSDFEQAKKWALRTTSNRKIGTPLVSVYEVDDEMAEKVRVLIFEATNKEWLRYIAANRTGKLLDEEYDIVIGPVANDQTIRTINNYLKGYFPEDVAIRLLLPQKLKDQYAFRTERALKLLKFVEAKNV